MAKYSYIDANGITFNNLESNPSPKKTINGKLFSTLNDFEYANEDGKNQLLMQLKLTGMVLIGQQQMVVKLLQQLIQQEI